MLDETTLGLIGQGFTDLGNTAKQVIALAVPAAIGVICLSGGVNYALSKVRGILGWA